MNNRPIDLLRLVLLVVIITMLAVIIGACAVPTPQVVEKPVTVVVEKKVEVVTTATPAPAPKVSAKYVFLFIGDGMGVTHRTAAELYLAATTGKKPEETRLLMNTFPAQGLITT